MSALVDLIMPLKTINPLNCREHHMARARRVKRERRRVDAALLAGPGWRVQHHLRRQLQAGAKLVVTLERRSRGLLDSGDNLPASMKGVRDQIAEWLGVDDRDPRVGWAYDQARASGFAVHITICPTDEGNHGT